MKKTLILASVYLFFLTGVIPSRHAGIMTLSDSISIKSVNLLCITKSPYVLKVALTLENESDQNISVRNGQFYVIINPENEHSRPIPKSLKKMIANMGDDDQIFPNTKLELGKTNPVSFDLEGCKLNDEGHCVKPGQACVKVEIALPGYVGERDYIIYKLLNYIGFPGSRKQICLIGDVEAGVKGKEGEKYTKIKLELYYKPPKIQSEVLFFGW